MSQTQGFNADKRAEKRESDLHTIGGQKYRSRRKTNGLLRGFRRMNREDGEHARKLTELARQLQRVDINWVKLQQEFLADKLTELPNGTPDSLRERLTAEYDEMAQIHDQLEAADDEVTVAERERLEDEIAEIEDEREELLYATIAHLVKKAETGDADDAADPAVLAEALDIDDASDFLEYLMPGDEADPTTTSSSGGAPA